MDFQLYFVNFLALVIFLMNGVLIESQTKIPVSTRYITTKETTLLQDQTKVFQATLCNEFYGHSINATMILNNNPTWTPVLGVVDYYIVDSPSKGRDKAVCTNQLSSGSYQANCYIKNWTSPSDLYVVATAIQTDSIVFTVDIEINRLATKLLPTVAKEQRRYPINHTREALKRTAKPSYNLKDAPELLSEIVNVGISEPLVHGKTALLNVTFCKNAQTTDNYEITSTVFGTDGKSSYTQYLCYKEPCYPGSGEVFSHEGKQLPVNVIKVTTQSGEYQNFLVLIVQWGGEYDPEKKENIGYFQYNAQIQPTQ